MNFKSHPIKTIFTVWFPLAVSYSFCLTTTAGQGWHIHNPPVEQAVPQFSQPAAQPSFKPLPAATQQPTIPNAVPQKKSPPAVNTVPSVITNPKPVTVQPAEPPTVPFVQTESAQPAQMETAASTSSSIYRDRATFPLDPRKPCHPCVQPGATSSWLQRLLPGNDGRPYQPSEPGGCLCNRKGAPKRDSFSVYWPQPLSAKVAPTSNSCRRRPLLDAFDPLVDFKLIPYQRTDSGHVGPHTDCFGCLGESKY